MLGDRRNTRLQGDGGLDPKQLTPPPSGGRASGRAQFSRMEQTQGDVTR